jgi:hypothetical protein
MPSFEDQLWSDLLREHGDDLAGAHRTSARPAQIRPLLLAAGAFGVVGAATAVLLALSATGGTPAYAVISNPDGTVTVTISEIAGIRGANAELARMHVRARAVPMTDDCAATVTPQPVDGSAAGQLRTSSPDGLTIVPNRIPAGATLMLVARETGSGTVAVGARLVRGAVPSCVGPRGLVGGWPSGAEPPVPSGTEPPRPSR